MNPQPRRAAVVAHLLARAFALLAVLLLAGCSSSGGNVLQIVESGQAGASGLRTTEGSCDDEALVQATVSGSAGSIRMRVFDGADAQVYDSGALSGSSTDQSLEVHGKAGTWRIEVQRTAFTGSYTAQVVC